MRRREFTELPSLHLSLSHSLSLSLSFSLILTNPSHRKVEHIRTEDRKNRQLSSRITDPIQSMNGRPPEDVTIFQDLSPLSDRASIGRGGHLDQ